MKVIFPKQNHKNTNKHFNSKGPFTRWTITLKMTIMCSHNNHNDKNIQMTTITIFLIPSLSYFFHTGATIKRFQPIKIMFEGKWRASICLLIPAEVMASLTVELNTEVQKNPTLFDKGHPLYKNAVMHAGMLFAFLDRQWIKSRSVK